MTENIFSLHLVGIAVHAVHRRWNVMNRRALDRGLSVHKVVHGAVRRPTESRAQEPVIGNQARLDAEAMEDA
jgi:hypothetical protein